MISCPAVISTLEYELPNLNIFSFPSFLFVVLRTFSTLILPSEKAKTSSPSLTSLSILQPLTVRIFVVSRSRQFSSIDVQAIILAVDLSLPLNLVIERIVAN